jgi:hypothetical protein
LTIQQKLRNVNKRQRVTGVCDIAVIHIQGIDHTRTLHNNFGKTGSGLVSNPSRFLYDEKTR